MSMPLPLPKTNLAPLSQLSAFPKVERRAPSEVASRSEQTSFHSFVEKASQRRPQDEASHIEKRADVSSKRESSSRPLQTGSEDKNSSKTSLAQSSRADHSKKSQKSKALAGSDKSGKSEKAAASQNAAQKAKPGDDKKPLEVKKAQNGAGVTLLGAKAKKAASTQSSLGLGQLSPALAGQVAQGAIAAAQGSAGKAVAPTTGTSSSKKGAASPQVLSAMTMKNGMAQVTFTVIDKRSGTLAKKNVKPGKSKSGQLVSLEGAGSSKGAQVGTPLFQLQKITARPKLAVQGAFPGGQGSRAGAQSTSSQGGSAGPGLPSTSLGGLSLSSTSENVFAQDVKEMEGAMSSFMRSQGIKDMVRAAHMALSGRNTGQINLVLRPDSLGKVKIDLNIKDGKLAGKITVQSSTAQQIFSDNLGGLRAALSQSGFESPSLSLSLSDMGAGAQGNSSGEQGSSEQQGRQREDRGSAAIGRSPLEPSLHMVGEAGLSQFSMLA